jgi:long-subunit acyl-CoA synthetase (AMP-forming)
VSKLKLGAVVDDKPVKLTVEIPATIHRDLMIVRGPNLMQGYHNKSAETASALKKGWYHTGDLAKSATVFVASGFRSLFCDE